MIDNRNMILAIVLSVAIIIGFEFFNSQRRPPAPVPGSPGEQVASPTPALPAPGSQTPPAPATAPRAELPVPPGTAVPSVAAPSGDQDRAAILNATPRLKIVSSRLHGSIALKGGRIDDLTLADYHEDLDPTSREIVLFSPHGAENAYLAEFGWVAAGDVLVPGPDTLWKANRAALIPGAPVTLRWDNGQGLRFLKTIALDDDYMFSITRRVENSGTESAAFYPYGFVARTGTPEVTRFFILHEGLLGVLEGTLKEVDYDDLQEQKVMEQPTTGGWVGITDKYWLAALVPDQKTPVQTRFTYRAENEIDKYQVDFLGPQMTAKPGGVVETTDHLFAGAKEVKLLDGYTEDLGIERLDLAIDFGWFYFLTKPIFYTLIYLNDFAGNFGVAILLLTIVIKLAFFPLANKSYRAMSKMKKLQPEMLKLRERFGDDKQRINQEMMALYKREKANPAAGCLPMLVQIPVFFALYKVLFVTIEMRHAPFFGWVQDLSAPDPTTMFNLFGLLPFTPPEFLMIGIWPLIMGATMFLQQRLNPTPADPIQAKIFMFLPIVFTVLLAPFPAGLVIYWAWNNTLSILQQWVIMRRMGVTA
ncbi:MAG: membrane protein insertase YidC [Rhodospirillales bacterium]|nr:membrane protein insertase YidC [Rhodospirillales bacterium]